ncbi:MAG: TadE/TadG family type IV pilus assembly protein [Ahrensia sp.]
MSDRYIKQISRFKREEGGNFAIMFALVATPVLLASSMMIDYSNMTRVKSQTMFAADTAIMAAASNAGKTVDLNGLDTPADIARLSQELGEDFDNYFIANLPQDLQQYVVNSKTTYDNTEHKFKATIDFRYDVALMSRAMPEGFQFSGTTEVDVDLEERASLSLMLVLDDSGSMDWYGRKPALQAAISAMMIDIDNTDPDSEFVRTGAISYAYGYRADTAMSWNEQAVINFANNQLIASGGTRADDSVRRAASALGDGSDTSAEYLHHMDRSGKAPRRAMVVMSDGVIAQPGWFYQECNAAKASGILIYTVAFTAPANGAAILRNCANGSSFHYDAANAAELTEVFKRIGKDAMERIRFST